MVLHGGYRLTREEIGRLTPGEILDLVFADQAYRHNQAGLLAYHIRSGLGMTRRG